MSCAKLTLTVAGLLCMTAVQAQGNTGAVVLPSWLPSTAQATAWIEGDASVLQARQGMAAGEHAALATSAGNHEWTLRVQAQRRQWRDGGPSSREWMAHLERPLRWPGKAGLDERLGDAERQWARAMLGEARHESARALADLWLMDLVARRREELLGGQVALAEANLAAVQKRRRAGDASLLDEQQARADAGDVARELILAQTVRVKALAGLQTRFGALVPEGVTLGEPGEPALPQPAWQARVLDEADALKARQAAVERARLGAARAHADRRPDPVIGVFTAREARGTERLVGLSVSLPLGGQYREQRASQQDREADMAASALEKLRREVELEARETWADAQGSRSRWQLSHDTARLALENARLAQRGYALGEADLQSLLLARRQAGLSGLAALEAQGEALRWEARLLIDAHLVWDLEHD